MNKVLNKRLIRDLKSNSARYFALFMLIVMGMYIIISLVGAAETIITGSAEHAEANCVEDGQFSVFLPLTAKQEKQLTDSGVTLEKAFYLDLEAGDGSVIRLMKNREKINLAELDEGRLAVKTGEIVLEKRYCEEHEISAGDTVTIGGTDFAVTGIGTVPDYDMPTRKFSDTAVESSLFGFGLVTDEQYEKIKTSGKVKTEEYCYAYRLGGGVTHDELKEALKAFEFDYNDIEDIYFKEMAEETIGKKDDLQNGIKELSDGANSLVKEFEDAGMSQGELYSGALKLAYGSAELRSETDDLLDEFFKEDIDNLVSFTKAGDNPRILAAAGDMQMNKDVGLIAGVIVMALFTYVISVFVVHQIQRESSVIGTLYALGAKKRTLIFHYITLPTIITFCGGLAGSIIGFSGIGIPVQMEDSFSYYSVPKLDIVYSPYLILYAVVMPPIISAAVNFTVINKKLSQTALSLIRNEQKISGTSSADLGKMNFIKRFQIRQMLREARTGITVILGMTMSLLILMLGLDCFALCNNIKRENSEDTKFEYMYTLKYPENFVPDGAEAFYAETLSKTDMGYTLDISVIGSHGDSKYYSAVPQKGLSSVVVSSAVSQKYGLKKGDKLILTDSAKDMDYAFTVKDIVDYSVGLTVFMDINSMRELFGKDDDYYNMLLSDKPLDIEEGRLYSVTARSDVERSAAVFTDLMKPMVITMIAASIIIFCVVMYLMMNVMIERASFGISLIKIFGFRTEEIRKLYLNGNMFIVAFGAIAGIPVSKLIMDGMYPYFLSNVTCGIFVDFEWYYYVLIFAAVMAAYFIINHMLVSKLKKITPAEVLKNRE